MKYTTEELKFLQERAKELGRGNCYTKKYAVEIASTVPYLSAEVLALRDREKVLVDLLTGIKKNRSKCFIPNDIEGLYGFDERLDAALMTDADQIVEEAKRRG